ncbi:hypothetical protein CKA32_002875 [Geitlerinema sp. FC II]|nr:hypothetical protein CKA32_002875 [Geitlerinema sp. FC II]
MNDLYRLASTVSAIAGVLAVPITSVRAQIPYPSEVIDEFVAACVSQDIDYAAEVCQCTIGDIQQQYSFAEFERISSNAEQGNGVPVAMSDLFLNCYASVSQRYTGSAYPPHVVENFLASCAADGTAEMRSACQCTIDEIQQQYTFAEFVAFDRAVAAGNEPPPAMMGIIEACLGQL